MWTKKDLLKEVYRLRNMIAGEKGTQQIALDKLESDYRFQRELRDSKGYELREQIDALNREYTRIVEDKQRKVRNDAYFATPEALRTNDGWKRRSHRGSRHGRSICGKVSRSSRAACNRLSARIGV